MVKGNGHTRASGLTEIASTWVTPRVDVLGVGISAIDMPTALHLIDQWILQGDCRYICVTGVHGVMESQRDPVLRRVHNRSGLTVPDGMPLVWAGWAAGARHMDRVYGPDLMLAACERATARGYSSFFYGGRPGVAERLTARLVGAFPGLKIVGTYAPPFRELSAQEDEKVVQLISAAQPDLVWVGLGTPKQELWMAAHAHRIDAGVLIGVGAAFDIHAGLTRQAAHWMQRSGLEWAFRLAQEPRRLWRRYLYNNPRFVAGVARRPPCLVPVTGKASATDDPLLSVPRLLAAGPIPPRVVTDDSG
jgi:N-acetylglucosaminyldiphosphoundecaprenol N-acetyl-beta-D-mannosaminyltransferase